MRDNTHKGGGDTRTQILHFKENPFFLPSLFAQPRRIKTRWFALVAVMSVLQTDKMRTAHAAVSLIVHSVDKTSEGMFDFFFDDSR